MGDPKGIKWVLFIWLYAISISLAEICFDGTNSYATYQGSPVLLETIHTRGPGIGIPLQSISPGQIDYNIQNKESNRSDISDPEGMRLEAEGIYFFEKRSDSIFTGGRIQNIETQDGNILFALGCVREARFGFKIEVIKLGLYQFTLDGAFRQVDRSVLLRPVLNMYGVNGQLGIKDLLANWTAPNNKKYTWKELQKDMGRNENDEIHMPFVELKPEYNQLIFEFETQYGFACEAFRVTEFKQEGEASPIWDSALAMGGSREKANEPPQDAPKHPQQISKPNPSSQTHGESISSTSSQQTYSAAHPNITAQRTRPLSPFANEDKVDKVYLIILIYILLFTIILLFAIRNIK